jgi:hypothetical protein
MLKQVDVRFLVLDDVAWRRGWIVHLLHRC